jgi:hypothetical protein
MIIDNASNQQYSLVSSENKAEANVNLSCFITFIVKKSHLLKKWAVVGRTAPVVGQSPTMPYPGYATNLGS